MTGKHEEIALNATVCRIEKGCDDGRKYHASNDCYPFYSFHTAQ